MPDASRAVGVASNLLSDELQDALRRRGRRRLREDPRAARRQEGPDADLARGRARECVHDRLDALRAAGADGARPPRVPQRRSRARSRSYIDWGPFFQAWELSGPFPAILDDPVVGEAARNVHAEGQAMLRDIVDGRWLTANGVVALLPANSVGDDIEMYADETRAQASR